MSNSGSLEYALATILEPMGVRALKVNGRFVNISTTEQTMTVRLALPARSVDVAIEQYAPTTAVLIDRAVQQLENGRDQLFRATVDHIAAHDRNPLDRMRAVEDAAQALLQALDINLDEIRMSYGVSNRVLNAAWTLRELLKQKPGAVTWSSNGYGADPQPEPHP